jgi:hypothetical protein
LFSFEFYYLVSIAMRGFAISFLTLPRVALPGSFFAFLWSIAKERHGAVCSPAACWLAYSSKLQEG